MPIYLPYVINFFSPIILILILTILIFHIACVSKYSGGEIKYYPGFHSEDHPEQVIRFCVDFKRYVTRKIGFEAVMRIRCTRGEQILLENYCFDKPLFILNNILIMYRFSYSYISR